jgi:SAM-dependent methyltransferase
VNGNGGRTGGSLLGVNVAGYFQSVLGVGEAARQVVRALETGGVPVAPVGLTAANSRQDERLAPVGDAKALFPINLICVNADVLPAFTDDAGPEFFAGRYSIGLWWWEVSKFPDRWLSAFQHVDEIWVGSRHVADALTPVSPVPVVHIVQPVAVAEPPVIDRAELGLPEGFVFLFSFDYHSVFERKNPLAVVEAFTRAFAPGDGPSLVIKSINHEHHPASHERLRQAAAAHPDVHLIDRHVSREERDALTATCDCYVSLHRSEGFGFTVAEAMAFARPVIATGYSGTMDFTTPANSYLVDYRLVPIGADADPYPADGEWAEPDVDHAARLMREVFENPDDARLRGERARDDLRERHSLEEAGRVMAERLNRIAGGFGPKPKARTPGSVDAIALRDRVASGPWTPAHYRFGAPQRLARKMLLRGLKPYTAYARAVDQELARGLESLDRSLQSLAMNHGGTVEIVKALQAERAASEARIDDLVRQVDELRRDAGASVRFLGAFGLGEAAEVAAADGTKPWPEAPEVPWTPEYIERHRDFVTRALDDPALLLRFRGRRELPAGYGVGFDERVVEFPWTVTRDLGGRVLDAGSTLNHPHVLARVRPHVDELHIVTLAPEQQAFPFLDISYLYADLRALPLQDATYDRIVSVSTLEHVGMDNSQYGAAEEPSADAGTAAVTAMRELRRVLRPGGVLYLTVPFGVREDLGWQRIFDMEALDALVEAFGPRSEQREFFRYSETGWQRCDAAEAADAGYHNHFANPAPAPDRAAAARAIACVELRA